MKVVLASVAAADLYAVAPGLQSTVPVTSSSAAFALPPSAYAAPAAYAQDEAYAVQYMPYEYVSQAQPMSAAEPTISSGLVALLGAGVGLAAGYAFTQYGRSRTADETEDLESARMSRTRAPQMMMAPSFAGRNSAAVAAPDVSRVGEPQMGATIRELRDRVGSVKNTKKITSAMKLVAAAKVRRAQEAVLRSRPFSETLERILGGLLQRVKTEGLDIPLLEERTVKKVGLVSITGDRGLCGGYNAQAIKNTEKRIEELKAQGVEVELLVIGNKGNTYFKKRDTPVRKAIPCGQAPTAEQAQDIASELLSSFYGGELDRVELLYTSFISMINSKPQVRTLIPLLPSGMEIEGDEIFKLTSKDGEMTIEKEKVEAAAPAEFVPDMIFEQEPSQLLNAILPLYLNGQILRTMQESVASELASRMSAMQAATDNAKDLQGRLESEMNRARQAKITQELMEIIAGADATG
jgi:F-type H+-transporting ATPase subunit gamma